MSRVGSKLLAIAVAMTLLVAAAGAQAAPVTIGTQMKKSNSNVFFGGPGTVFSASVAPPGNPVSPVSGTIVRWRVAVVGAGTGSLTLRVLQHAPGNKVTAISSGPSQEMSSGAGSLVEGQTIYTLPANLPIAAGQSIGIDGKAGSPEVAMFGPSGSFGVVVPPLPDGETKETAPFPGSELLVNADVQPPPTVASVTPSSGATAAGFPVVIAGTDFAGVKAVEFGSVPAARFIPGTEGELTAFPPPATTAGPVPVTVTTIAGKSTNAATFTYEAPPAPAPTCVVPRLKQKKLKGGRKALVKAGCKLGKVTRKANAGKGAKVTKQSPKPGTVLPVGGKVAVTVG